MPNSHTPEHFQLDTPQRTVALPMAAGTLVRVTQGTVWLTLEGHRRDVWLRTHDHWTVPLDATVRISAEGAATFTVERPGEHAPSRRRGVVGLAPQIVHRSAHKPGNILIPQ